MTKPGQNEQKIINWAGTEFKFFEEFIVHRGDGEWPRCAGTRFVKDNNENRPLGVAGRRDFTLTENVTLMRCFKEVILKASPKRPVRVTTYLQKLEGRRD